MVICLERGANLHMAQRIPMPLTVSCFSKIQIGFTFLVPAQPDKGPLNGCVCVCACVRACVCVRVKSAALVAAVFVDFPKNKCNFLHKSKLDIARRVQFLTGRRHMRSFFLVGQSPPLPYGSWHWWQRGRRRAVTPARLTCGVSAVLSRDL